MGGKPINNVVDVTNLIMLITAQPTHAYDYDTLESHTIGTRFARKGESVKLINGKTYELIESDIVIVDGARPIGLAGIMGGNDTEVTKNTTTIVLEVASFDMYALRRSSMRHGLFTDALTRFSKGQSPRQNPSVIQRLMHYIEEVAGGTQASEVFDMSKGLPAQPQLDVRTDFINDRLGLTLTTKQISTLLGNVEFAIKERQDNIEITVPFWRTDIVDPEDIVEEIGRLYGLDKLPRELPKRTATPTPRNRQRQLKRMLRESMKRLGANEVLTYSFVHEDVMKRAEQQIDQAFRLGNALSPDLQYYRLSVLPSLLDKVHMNIKAGHDEFVLYEIGKGHNKKYHASDDEGLPSEMAFVDAVYTSRNSHPGAAYYHVRKMLDQLSYDLGFGVIYKPIDAPLDFPVTAPFDLSRSALVETTEGIFVGMIGELKPSVLKGFKLPAYTAAMTLDTSGILSAYSTPSRAYRALSKYPSVSQDISLKVASAVTYQQLLDVVHTAILQRTKGSDFELTPQSIYQAKDDTSHKTISLRLRITNYEKTLTDADVTKLLDHAATVAKTELKAERI
jgi:phenylalanyl-tRNA synthetase beta chain